MSDPIIARLFWAFLALAVLFVMAVAALICTFVGGHRAPTRRPPRRRPR